MGKIAFVFPGQGAQYSGMGRSLAEHSASAKKVFEIADSLRPGTSAQCFFGSQEELSQTENTQPCLYCADLAAAYALMEAGVVPDMLAGFSLGEVAALTVSGATDLKDGFRIVCRRGALMQTAAENTDSTMLAVLKLENATVEELCRKYPKVYPVNYNCPGQLVVAGSKEQLHDFQADIQAAGGKGLFLNVNGGFHSPFMKEAADKFAKVLADVPFSQPRIPLYSNFTARPYAESAAYLLVQQIQNPVRWQMTVENMIADGAELFVEVGAKKILSKLISKISGAVRTYAVEDWESLQKTLTEVKRNA